MLAIVAASAALAMVQTGAADSCTHDRAQMLVLDQRAFDQDHDGGWRAVSRREGCRLAAADLIRDYRRAHRSEDGILYWHEGQLRAAEGQTEAAILLFERSRKSGSDDFGWNHYVDASIAFLRGNRPALIAARNALAGLPRPADFAPRDMQGRPVELDWPPNLNVVDQLVRCFGGSYAEAYGARCGDPPARPADRR